MGRGVTVRLWDTGIERRGRNLEVMFGGVVIEHVSPKTNEVVCFLDTKTTEAIQDMWKTHRPHLDDDGRVVMEPIQDEEHFIAIDTKDPRSPFASRLIDGLANHGPTIKLSREPVQNGEHFSSSEMVVLKDVFHFLNERFAVENYVRYGNQPPPDFNKGRLTQDEEKAFWRKLGFKE